MIMTIMNSLMHGDASLALNSSVYLNNTAMELLKFKMLNENQRNTLYNLLQLCNILYENLEDDQLLPIDNEVYDQLRELALNNQIVPPVGGVSININSQSNNRDFQPLKLPVVFAGEFVNNEDTLYGQKFIEGNIHCNNPLNRIVTFDGGDLKRRSRDTSHFYPNLVGTLNKAKFVMNYQAKDVGAFDTPNVKILERDFFLDHIKRGIITPDRVFTVTAKLKYDGVSVEEDMGTRQSTSRGDAIGGVATDLTPILHDYIFPNAPQLSNGETFGVQFEAIMTNNNLIKYNEVRNKNYKNCRTAIIGLFASSDAHDYIDYITLVPLTCSLDELNEIEKLEFINKYYSSGVQNLYEVFTGNYQQVLYQIKKFEEEAEAMRPYIPFMYDGIVITYVDEDIVQKLGRTNAVNNFSIAVKFNPLKKQSHVIGCSFSVGVNGIITPKVHFLPVEFMGTIHPKSSLHSLARFLELGLRYNDIIDLQYVNDVMPYATKPDNSFNRENTNPIIEFPTKCPVCGTPIEISDSGKSAICPNISCDGRKLARVINMIKKLKIKDFDESNLEKLGLYNIKDILEVTSEYAHSVFGELTAESILDQVKALKGNNLKDYEIVGSLGFDNIAEKKWKLILNVYSIQDILSMDKTTLYNSLLNIRGIGEGISTVVSESIDFFREDLQYILDNFENMVCTKGAKCTGKVIRMSGFRDANLISLLNDNGHDASDGSVVVNTDIFLVPYEGYSEGNKYKRVMDLNSKGASIQIVPIQLFLDNMDMYLE